MSSSRTLKSVQELDELAAIDNIRSFVGVQARDWHRRQVDVVKVRVLQLIDQAYAKTPPEKPDIPALIRQVWLERELPQLGSVD